MFFWIPASAGMAYSYRMNDAVYRIEAKTIAPLLSGNQPHTKVLSAFMYWQNWKKSFCLTGFVDCVNLLQIYALSVVMYKLQF